MPLFLCIYQLNFLHWMSDEPNNQNNIESCVEFRMYYWDEEGSWNDVHCEAYNDWLCEIRAGRFTHIEFLGFSHTQYPVQLSNHLLVICDL